MNRAKDFIVKKRIDYLCRSDGNFERTISGDGDRFSCRIEAVAAYTPRPKHRFYQLFFKAGEVTLMNISICI